MKITVTEFDLESMNEVQVGQLAKVLDSFPINGGYSRQDIEAIENTIPGAFTNVDGFNIKEIPTYASDVNLRMIVKRLSELKLMTNEHMNRRYDYYLSMFASTINQLELIVATLKLYRDCTPSPLSTDLTSIYLGARQQYDLINIQETDFSTLNYNDGISIPHVQDNGLNMDIDLYNDYLENCCTEDRGRGEFNGHILKTLLDTPKLDYNTLVSIFSNSNELITRLEALEKDIIHELSAFKREISYTDCMTSDYIEKWLARCINTSKYIPLSYDKVSGTILKIVGKFRYFRTASTCNE